MPLAGERQLKSKKTFDGATHKRKFIDRLSVDACGIDGSFYLANAPVPFTVIKGIVRSADFVRHVSLLKKYKSGGYYTFNSKDLQQYINYYLTFNHDRDKAPVQVVR